MSGYLPLSYMTQLSEQLSVLLEKQALSEQEQQTALKIIGLGIDFERDKDGAGAVHLAAANGHVVLLKKLIERPENLDAACKNGDTPLHVAVQSGKADCVQALLDAGADYETKNLSRHTPLRLAARFGEAKCLEALLKAGADPRATQTATTPLHEAASSKSRECARLLLQTEAIADIHTRDNFFITPLHAAAQYSTAETVQLLLDTGADPHARDNARNAPLWYAAQNEAETGLHELVQALVKAGADVRAASHIGNTALHHPLLRAKNVTALLEAGVPVNARNRNNNTPLHLVRIHGAPEECARLLLEAGASIWAMNNEGEMPLDWDQLKPHFHLWHPRLLEGYHPQTPKEVLCLISVLDAGNRTAIPEPWEQIDILFHSLPHTDDLNKLYKECTGKPRKPEAKISLKEMRQHAQSSGVGL